MAKRSNIKLVGGQPVFDETGRMNFPPENAITKSIKGSKFIEVDLVSNKNKGITR